MVNKVKLGIGAAGAVALGVGGLFLYKKLKGWNPLSPENIQNNVETVLETGKNIISSIVETTTETTSNILNSTVENLGLDGLSTEIEEKTGIDVVETAINMVVNPAGTIANLSTDVISKITGVETEAQQRERMANEAAEREARKTESIAAQLAANPNAFDGDPNASKKFGVKFVDEALINPNPIQNPPIVPIMEAPSIIKPAIPPKPVEPEPIVFKPPVVSKPEPIIYKPPALPKPTAISKPRGSLIFI